MKEIVKIFFKTLFLFLVIFSVKVHGKILSSGNANAKVTIIKFFIIGPPNRHFYLDMLFLAF